MRRTASGIRILLATFALGVLGGSPAASVATEIDAADSDAAPAVEVVALAALGVSPAAGVAPEAVAAGPGSVPADRMQAEARSLLEVPAFASAVRSLGLAPAEVVERIDMLEDDEAHRVIAALKRIYLPGSDTQHTASASDIYQALVVLMR